MTQNEGVKIGKINEGVTKPVFQSKGLKSHKLIIFNKNGKKGKIKKIPRKNNCN